MRKKCDVIIIGAGAAGMMCGIEAGARGREVVILEKSNKVGKKILMSGGGRCNFTHLSANHEKYISHNPHFCKSALSRYTPQDFLSLVKKHNIDYVEKTPGQFFCANKALDIVQMLLLECKKNNVTIELNQNIQNVTKIDDEFCISTQDNQYFCKSLVVACGGLSIPTLGSSPYGYQLAAQFGLKVYPTRAGLVPLTLQPHDKALYESLSGVSVFASAKCSDQLFMDDLLFTHRGLSGPVILQISSYWEPGSEISINLVPHINLLDLLIQSKQQANASFVKTILSTVLPKSILDVFFTDEEINISIKQLNQIKLQNIVNKLQNWIIKPNGTEGYRTAEVTLGGVDCNEVSSKSFETNQIKGLFFVGEVLDVAGWLGGYNFQWAWSSGWAAGQVV